MELTEAPPARRVEHLRRADLPVDTMELARYLIGKTLVHHLPTGRLSGRIVETEGYPAGDAAGRAFRGKTPGNQSLFLGRGYCHIYFTYGSSFMVNVTSEEPDVGAGVLLRALEPLEGIETMQRFQRRRACVTLPAVPDASPKPCTSTNDTTVLIYALRVRFGLARHHDASV